MARDNPFAVALRAVESSRLRTAFEASSEADPEGGYERTTLNRWLDGTVPLRGDFVQLLADALDDPSVHTAWQEARGERTGSSAKAVVSRFENLPDAERDEAFHEIRRDYVSRGKSERRGLVYRITVNDPVDGETDHLLLRVDISWKGRLPANAEVAFVTDQEQLGNAYGQADCIFREIIDFDIERLTELFEGSAGVQVLAYNPMGVANPRPVTHEARVDAGGVATFDNAEVEQAHIKLSLSYPVPKGTPMFAIKIGEYSVPGTAEATLTLNSRSASRPRAFAFLAPGRQREWASNHLRDNELFVSLGTAATVLGEGDGVVLSWTIH